jgi:hypothetical protein
MTLKPVIELQEYSNCWLSIKDVTGTWSSSSNNTILYYDEDRSNAAGTPYSTKWSTSISIIILSK